MAVAVGCGCWLWLLIVCNVCYVPRHCQLELLTGKAQAFSWRVCTGTCKYMSDILVLRAVAAYITDSAQPWEGHEV